MKKIGNWMMTVLLLLVMLVPLQAVNTETKALYKYGKLADGSYGYDETKQVMYYKNAEEPIMIPTEYTQPKEQLKSTWIATIANLNFPTPTSETHFKTEFQKRVDTLKQWNMNAVIFQVRPLLDAYYASDINPTSQYLSGKQGTDVAYDPLKIMVDMAHENGLEYHAWFNPYRVTMSKLSTPSVLDQIGLTKEEALALSVTEQLQLFKDKGILADTNFAVLHPEWVLRFDEKLLLNPGIPEVQQHVIQTVNEVIAKYDVDGIHFDDYFYPYRIGENYFGTLNEDRATFEALGLPKGYEDTQVGIENWRRDNITNLVQGVKKTIDTHNKDTKSSVQFGISPFGIWEHKVNDERGSNTPSGSSQSYSRSIYADTYKWMKEETLDYVVPQIYWSFGQEAAPYGELARWWNDVAKGTRVQVYVGHPNYKHVSNGGWDPEWLNPEEISHQLYFNQQFDQVRGSVLFSYNDLVPSSLDTLDPSMLARHEAKNKSIDILKNDTFSQPSFAPAKPWLSVADVLVPQSVSMSENIVTWEDSNRANIRYYRMYEGVTTQTNEEIISNPSNMITNFYNDNVKDLRTTVTPTSNSKFVITAVDKANNESAPQVVTDSQKLIPDIKIRHTDVQYQKGQQISAEQFIQDLQIQANLPIKIVTDFSTTVDLTTEGTYTVRVEVHKESSDFVRAVADTLIYEGGVQVTVVSNEQSLITETSSTTTQLPRTGQVVGEMLLLGGVLMLSSAGGLASYRVYKSKK